MKNEVKNKPQTSQIKNDKKNKQEISGAYAAQQPNAQQNNHFYPQAGRYIRSWVEGAPDQHK
jgi:hypothetical protein